MRALPAPPRTADARTRQEMREGIQIVHAELEASGTLGIRA